MTNEDTSYDPTNRVSVSDDNGERVAHMRLRQAKIHVGIGIGIILLLALALLCSAVLLLLPYHPMKIYSYTPEAEEVCPDVVVPVAVDYEIQPGATIDTMEVRAGWEVVDVPGYMPGMRIFNVRTNISAPDDYFESGFHQRETRAPRISPGVPGEWIPVSETTVRGWSYGVPHVQTIKNTERQGGSLTVLDASKCK